MLIMHAGEPENQAPSGPSALGLPALMKREVVRSDFAWRQETGGWRDGEQQQQQEQPGVVAAAPLPDLKPKKKAKKDVFICNEVHCGKQFPRSFALRRHMRIHTGTKPYACDYDGCAQRFNTSGNLSRHKRIHSGERPYPCIFSTCGKRFNTSTKLKRHMRIHFPEGQNLFRCIGVDCSWSCDNYKEFAQHQKLHHNIIVGAQQEHAAARQHAAAAVAAVNASAASVAVKDNEYFSTADSTRGSEYDHQHQLQSLPHQHHHAPPPATGSFLYGSSFPPEKPKASVLPPPSSARNKLMGQFFGGPGDLVGASSLPAMLQKEQQKKAQEMDHIYGGGDQRRGVMKASGNSSAFPSVQYPPRTSSGYDSVGSSFALSSESAYSRSTGGGYMTSSSHFAPLRPDDNGDRDDDGYDHHQQHSSVSQQHLQLPPPGHHVLRPPPQGSEDVGKYGGFSVPPPMNPAAPEFTGEELSVVLQLMNENYC